MDWLWQGIVSNLTWEILVVAAGIAMALLRKKDSKWAGPIIFGLLTITALSVLWFTITGRSLFSPPRVEVSPENIEKQLKTWCENVAIGTERTEEPDSYFAYTLRSHGGDPVNVFRAKHQPGYLQFKGLITFAPEHQAALAKLSNDDEEMIFQQLVLELAKANLSAVVINDTDSSGKPVHTGVVIQKAVPIPTLNEGFFVDCFDQTTRGMAIVRAYTRLALRANQSKLPVANAN